MLGNYLNQDAVWLKPGGYGPDGPIMDEVAIKVRWEGKRRLVRDASGRQVVVRAGCTAVSRCEFDMSAVVAASCQLLRSR